MNYTITANPAFNSLEIAFDGKPAQEVRDALKALKFRWHSQKKVWYGYTTEEAARAAIEGKPAEKEAEKPAEKKAAKGTPQDHVRIYWNGIKIDGGKLIRCGYSLDNNADHAPSVSIHARDYADLPRDLLPVENNSDSYTDYFEHDHAYITPAHPLYKYFRYAAAKAAIRDLKGIIAFHEKELAGRERWYGQHDFYRKENERDRAKLAELESLADPGQPTAEDLAEIDRQKQEAENARKAAEHEEQLRQREAYLRQRNEGRDLINAEAAAHPIRDGEPVVCINWSEHPGFYEWGDDALRLSVTAAEKILAKLDKDQHDTRETPDGAGWYFKTSFTITGKDESGDDFTYTGRYDLGDNDGGLVEHIRAFGRYYLTHDEHGHEKAQPDKTNDTIQFAEFLAQFVEA